MRRTSSSLKAALLFNPCSFASRAYGSVPWRVFHLDPDEDEDHLVAAPGIFSRHAVHGIARVGTWRVSMFAGAARMEAMVATGMRAEKLPFGVLGKGGRNTVL